MNQSEAAVRLGLVEELSRKWHRHSGGKGDFERGMNRAYADCLRLILGSASIQEVERHLQSDLL